MYQIRIQIDRLIASLENPNLTDAEITKIERKIKFLQSQAN